MRCNQVTIFIERFGKYVPKNYPGDIQRISVYADDFQSVYAALSKAYALAVDELGEYETIGVSAEVTTNEYSKFNNREMRAKPPKGRIKYEDDVKVDWHYLESREELCRDYIWAYEHSAEIIETIKSSTDTRDTVVSLKEKFGLSDYQVRKLLQFRFDMLMEQEYEKNREEISRIEEKRDEVSNLPREYESRDRFVRRRIFKLNCQIEETSAFLLAAEHYPEIIQIMENSADFPDFAGKMEAKYGFSWNQSRYFQHMSIQEFNRKAREEMRERLRILTEEKEMYEKELEKEENSK